MDLVKGFIEKIKVELTEKGNSLNAEEVNSFYKWMEVEYKNYMLLHRETCIETLDKLKTVYGHFAPMIEVLEDNINEYGSLQGYYRASLDLLNCA